MKCKACGCKDDINYPHRPKCTFVYGKQGRAPEGGEGSARHTPTPWKIYDTRKTHRKGKLFITGQAYMLAELPALPESEANAELIVRAVNNHETLLKIAKEMLEFVENSGVHCGQWGKAIAQAEGKGE